MNKRFFAAALAGLVAVFLCQSDGFCASRKLAKPAIKGSISLEEALAKRKSVRSFLDKPLDIKQIAQLVWAAQGVTHDEGKRTAPSAGALYPLMMYVVAGDVNGLSQGVYRYNPEQHALTKVKGGDQRASLAKAARGQQSVASAPASFVVAVNYERMARYEKRGKMFADIEQGHAVQNLLLQAVSLGLGAVPVGAVSEGDVDKLLDLPSEFSAGYIIPVGFPD
jgi:SagB-type dehydrogenase family enzyme